ncbi:hypothetical protein P8452_37451 [Trifolium repens]|nr:hypothetical protein P8452_37451 [Trifolium repens]
MDILIFFKPRLNYINICHIKHSIIETNWVLVSYLVLEICLYHYRAPLFRFPLRSKLRNESFARICFPSTETTKSV